MPVPGWLPTNRLPAALGSRPWSGNAISQPTTGWTQNIENWKPPTFDDTGGSGLSAQQQASALWNNFQLNTEADRYANVGWLGRMGKNVMLPYIYNWVTQNSGANPALDTSMSPEILRNWILNNPKGWAQNYGGQVQGFLNNLRSWQDAEPGSREAMFQGFINQSPELLASMLGANLTGPFGEYQQRRLGQTVSAGLTSGDKALDWVRYFLENSGLPYSPDASPPQANPNGTWNTNPNYSNNLQYPRTYGAQSGAGHFGY